MAGKNKRTLIVIEVVILVVAIVLSSFVYLNFQEYFTGKTDNVSLGNFFGTSEPYAVLVYIAQNQHFFAQNDINLTIADYSSATTALNAALNGKVDLAVSSEYAFVVTNVLQKGDLKVIATIDKAQSVSIVCRKDRGISTIADLAGKNIALTFQIAPQFYLARFLELNNINLAEVNQINMPTTQYVTAIVNGSVDAVVVSDSSISQIQSQLPNDTVVWSVQNDQLLNMVLSGRNEWIAQHPDLVERFLKSLAQSQDYVFNNPTGAQTIIQKQLNLTSSLMKEKWSSHQFSLSLDQTLVSTMENEARWMINNNLTNQTTVPNFLNYIYFDGLESAKPESVNIIQ
jgi:NitT/TauT family transport system substrate-binding protein